MIEWAVAHTEVHVVMDIPLVGMMRNLLIDMLGGFVAVKICYYYISYINHYPMSSKRVVQKQALKQKTKPIDKTVSIMAIV